jgi:DNA helicase-2/ATP-dependent DNA helicase PcrA
MAWDAGLLPDQRTAAAHVGSHARLLAGPGTGKTWTLTKRILFLVEDQKVDPVRVVALTFTRAAAYELRDRIQKELAGKFATRPTVATLHSYALRNLLYNAHRLDALPQPLRIADDWEERQIIIEDLKVLIRADVDTVRERLTELSADWNTLGIDGDPDQRKANPGFVGAWREHRQVYGYTLRAELVYQLKHALEQRADIELVPPGDYLLVDEYQDLNACDAAVVNAIRGQGFEVYGAGDDDQSIYGFRHALPAGIRGFLERYAPAADLKLEVCLRCDTAIINLAKFVAQLDPHSIDKPLLPRDGAGAGEVRLLRFNNQFEEANAVASICRYLVDDVDHSPDDILILLRSDRRGAFSRPVAEALRAAGVPVNLNVSDETPLDTNEGRIVLAFLRLCRHGQDSLAWRTLLKVRHNRIGDGAIGAVYDLARAQGITFGTVLAEKDLSAIPKFGNRLQVERTAILRDLLDICPLLDTPTDGSQAPPLAERLGRVLEALVPATEQRAEVAEYLQTILVESDALTLAELLQAVSATGSETEQALVQGAVNVLTMHRAKGLSARTVIVMAAEDEYIPGKQAGITEDDERRLLYVSLTRARQRLIITFVNKRTGQQRHTGRTSGEAIRTLTRYLQDAPLAPRDGNEYVRALGG